MSIFPDDRPLPSGARNSIHRQREAEVKRHALRCQKRLVLMVLVLACVSLSAGCYSYHVYQVGGTQDRELGNQPATEWQGKTLHSFLWGNVRQDLPVANCTLGDGTRTGIEEIRVNTNLGYAALTVLTLGIWSPLKVNWRCAKPQGPRGRLS